ncbi:MAG TPA: hypothetical protein VGB91_10305, partial [Rhizomicrobium sp.]
LLLALTPGDGGERAAGGAIGAPERAGRVFYGPYCRLPPGDYQFELRCDMRASVPGRAVTLEIVAGDRILAQDRFALKLGPNLLAIRFEVPQAGTAADLLGPLEFRLGKDEGLVFDCTSAELRAASNGSR